MAIAAMIVGIISLVFCWVPVLNWILPVLGVIFGAVGIKVNPDKAGMAIAGLVTSIIALAIALIQWVACGGAEACVLCAEMM